MKAILHVCIGLLLILPLFSGGQSIMAGQTSGENIVYHDIDDLHIDSPYWNSSDEASIDLNDDGINDLRLMTSFTYWSHPDILFANAAANGTGECQYSTIADHPDWIRKHGPGDLIGPSLNWYIEPGPSYSGVFHNTDDQGNFVGEGYMAYRICGTDTTYGWIRIYCNAGFDGAYLTVYDFAYADVSTGIAGDQEVTKIPSFRVEGDRLRIDIPEEIYNESGLVSGFDLSGRLVFQIKPEPGRNCYTFSGRFKGLLIVRYTDGQRLNYSSRLVSF